MIEVRLFAGLRQGRQKVCRFAQAQAPTPLAAMELLGIRPQEVNILLVNGFHRKADHPLQPGDVLSLFPAVGGG